MYYLNNLSRSTLLTSWITAVDISILLLIISLSSFQKLKMMIPGNSRGKGKTKKDGWVF